MTNLAARYAFAGNAFLKPEPARLAALARELGDDEAAGAIEASPETLEQEYNRLFLNPLGTPCPPWQSAQSEEKRLMGEPHLRALEWFRRYGVEPVAGNDPADHAGLLLLFYSRLLHEGAGPEVLDAFHQDHLGWIPGFCNRVQAEARHPFYRMLADRTASLIGEPAAG